LGFRSQDKGLALAWRYCGDIGMVGRTRWEFDTFPEKHCSACAGFQVYDFGHRVLTLFSCFFIICTRSPTLNPEILSPKLEPRPFSRGASPSCAGARRRVREQRAADPPASLAARHRPPTDQLDMTTRPEESVAESALRNQAS